MGDWLRARLLAGASRLWGSEGLGAPGLGSRAVGSWLSASAGECHGVGNGRRWVGGLGFIARLNCRLSTEYRIQFGKLPVNNGMDAVARPGPHARLRVKKCYTYATETSPDGLLGSGVLRLDSRAGTRPPFRAPGQRWQEPFAGMLERRAAAQQVG